MLWTFLIGLAFAGEPARDVEVACGWAADGKASRAVPLLEAALRADLPAGEAARAWGCLAHARADLADDPERKDTIAQLDSAAFAWKKCVDLAEGPAGRACAGSAARLSAVTLGRAEWLRSGLEQGRPGFLPAEAVERCRQAGVYEPSSLRDEVCLGRLGATLADVGLAAEGARGALALGRLPDQAEAQDAALAAGLDVPLRLHGDDEAARLLAATLRAHPDAAALVALPHTASALQNLETFQARLAPLRAAARSTDPKAHKVWLQALLDAKWVDLAAREAARTEAALPDDAAMAELAGVVRVNALAGGAGRRAETLAAARASLQRCLALEPAHPRCGAHLTRLPPEAP